MIIATDYQPMLYELLGKVDGIFTPARPQRHGRDHDSTPDDHRHRRVSFQLRTEYHRRGCRWHAGGSDQARQAASRLLDAAAAEDLLRLHHDRGRVSHVRFGSGVEDYLRVAVALPTLLEGWPLLLQLAEEHHLHPERELAGDRWHHEHFHLKLTGADVATFEELAMPLLTAGYVVTNTCMYGLASFAITPAGLDAVDGAPPAMVQAPMADDSLNRVYLTAWREQLDAIEISNPASRDLEPLPLPASAWYSEVEQ